MERTYFPPEQEPEVFTMNICEQLMAGKHDECPGWLKYDAEQMEPPKGKKATEQDTVFCICPCHRKPQA